MKNKIVIKGAREHNLKNINLEIPKNKLVVFTGVSGSGKSSLGLDTLFAEGQRRYVQSLSSYARQFLGLSGRPDVDTIEGLSPAIAISQTAISRNPRSTVGTVTEIYDYLRLLFARLGHPHCPQCGREISAQSPEEITKQILNFIEQQKMTGEDIFMKFLILSPVVKDRKGEFQPLFANLKTKGYQKVRIDGYVFDLDEEFALIKTNRHHIEVIVDRLVINFQKSEEASLEKLKLRLSEAVKDALKLSNGLLILSVVKDKDFQFPEKPKKMEDYLFSQLLSCPLCNLSLPNLEPRLFSFNSPQGACEECHGLGKKMRLDPQKVSPWRIGTLQRRYLSTASDYIRHEIEKLMIKETCPLCLGKRLKKEALSITINQKTIADYNAMTTKELLTEIKKLPSKLSTREKKIGQTILKEILSRLNFLNSVGLNYISLERESATLAAGEAQRIRLASQIGTSLTGVLYILDEPTIGLHPQDNHKLIKNLLRLRDLGNTVIVIEHDKEMISNADWLIDFGPGAGKNGGKIVFEGRLKEIKKNSKSLTGQYLRGQKKVTVIKKMPSKKENFKPLIITGCQEHNLKNLTVSFPLNQLICITGVSGSGKSTLIHDTLYHALKKKLNPDYREKVGQFENLKNFEAIHKILLVDQSPIGRTSRSNPATYISAFTEIRNLFSQLRQAKIRGWGKSYFSFNTPGGRCEECRGQGEIKIEMQFLPDVYIPCQTCQGRRFTEEILSVEYKGQNIAAVLRMTVKEALDFFKNIPALINKLANLEKVGLGYLELGQPSTTLSGGESQRLKIARELSKSSQSHTLYLMDEPTTGLHFEDLKKLINVLRELVSKGNSVIVIEHNPDLVKNADWVIDLGPKGGEQGGEIVAQGTVEQIKKNKKSSTGKFL